MPVDQIGNPLLIDDLVSVQSGDQMFLGIVKEINEPSVIAPGPNQMQMPGTVKIVLLPMTVPFDIRNPRCVNVTKVVKPPNFGKKEN